MIYGIRHFEGKVKAFSRFKEELPANFIEIDEADYKLFLKQLKENPFSIYDPVNNVLIQDQSALDTAKTESNKAIVRARLKALSIEFDLKERLGEDTTDITLSFNTLKAEYEAM